MVRRKDESHFLNLFILLARVVSNHLRFRTITSPHLFSPSKSYLKSLPFFPPLTYLTLSHKRAQPRDRPVRDVRQVLSGSTHSLSGGGRGDRGRFLGGFEGPEDGRVGFGRTGGPAADLGGKGGEEGSESVVVFEDGGEGGHAAADYGDVGFGDAVGVRVRFLIRRG